LEQKPVVIHCDRKKHQNDFVRLPDFITIGPVLLTRRRPINNRNILVCVFRSHCVYWPISQTLSFSFGHRGCWTTAVRCSSSVPVF